MYQKRQHCIIFFRYTLIQKSKRVLANYIEVHIAHARSVPSSTSRKRKTTSPNKTPKQNLPTTLPNHSCFLLRYCETHLRPWTSSLADFKLLPSTNYWHAWTVKNVGFFFFNNGKSIFHPSFPKPAGAVWRKCSKNISTSKGLPNSSKKGKMTGEKDKPLKIFY